MHRVLHTMALKSLMDFHIAFMPYVWSILIDTALFLPFYVHSKYSIPVHALLTSLALGITVLTSSNSWTHGIPPPSNPMHFHKLFGVIIFGVATLQMILGLISKLSKSSKSMKSQHVYYLRKIHTYSGYIIALMAKFQVLKQLKSSHFAFWFNLFWNIATITLFIYRKFTQEKLASNPSLIVKEQQEGIPSGKDEESALLIYGNYLYSRQQIEEIHPAGKEVIDSLKGTCLDRYLYGMMPAQGVANLPLHSHSTQVMKILGSPRGKLEIKQPHLHFDKEDAEVLYYSSEPVSQEGGLYLVLVEVQTENPIKFRGYNDVNQLGRYYSLSFAGMTRLYSVVNFLNYQNVLFLKNVLGNIELSEGILVETSVGQYRLTEEINEEESPKKEALIPLLIKFYPDGRFTPHLLRKRANGSIVLSSSKGRGLQLGQLFQGTIVMIGGGTGINPYCDLIDLLFKEHLLSTRPDLEEHILQNNPVLRSKPFASLNFIFIFALKYMSEIHPFTLAQLKVLAGVGKVQLKLRVKQNIKLQSYIQQVQESFEHILTEMLRNNEEIHRVYICGTQKMNTSLSKCLDQLSYHRYIVL